MDGLSNVFARNCSVRRVDKTVARAFLASGHRMGYASCRYAYGLFVDRSTGSSELGLPVGSLVAVSLFSNARRWPKGDRTVSSYEWVRYASLPGVRVVGGMGKMLRAFIDDVHPDDVMSYADPSSADGGAVYETLGFKNEGRVERPTFSCLKYRLSVNPYV